MKWPRLASKTTPLEIPPLPEFIQRVTAPVDYPSGVVVETEDGVYLVKGKSRYKMYSPRVVDSWNVDLLPGTKASVSKLKYAGTLGFRSGTLVRNIADGKVYLISDNKRRHITDPDVFVKFGLDESLIVEVSEAETNLHEEGEVLS